jgi:uncharacterized protein (DUF1697 family)
MGTFAVLLRGVNVGPHHRIAMPAFRSLLEGIGATEVQTYVQSGNAVVGWAGSPGSLADRVAQALREELDLAVPLLVRSADELEEVVAGNPFADEELDPKLLHACFLGGDLPPGLVEPESLLPDRVVPGPGLLYIAYAGSTHDAKATKLLNSKRFPVVMTARNWRTVLALRDLARR